MYENARMLVCRGFKGFYPLVRFANQLFLGMSFLLPFSRTYFVLGYSTYSPTQPHGTTLRMYVRAKLTC